MINYTVRILAMFWVCLGVASTVFSQTLFVENVSGNKGGTVEVAITVEIPENVLGAVFSVFFDTEQLELQHVSSPFFQNFAQQQTAASSSENENTPTHVVVDGVTYVQPLIFNASADGIMLAAANAAAAGGESTLFILEFSLQADIPDGIYPVSVTTSFISNTAAGYPAEGLGLPLLFPDTSVAVVNGRISVNMQISDTDGDGIDDNWEMLHFGSLQVADRFTDFDGDGYTDLQEYLNETAGITDKSGMAFNPKATNASGGIGYIAKAPSSNILKLIIPMLTGKNIRTGEVQQQP